MVLLSMARAIAQLPHPAGRKAGHAAPGHHLQGKPCTPSALDRGQLAAEAGRAREGKCGTMGTRLRMCRRALPCMMMAVTRPVPWCGEVQPPPRHRCAGCQAARAAPQPERQPAATPTNEGQVAEAPAIYNPGTGVARCGRVKSWHSARPRTWPHLRRPQFRCASRLMGPRKTVRLGSGDGALKCLQEQRAPTSCRRRRKAPRDRAGLYGRSGGGSARPAALKSSGAT